MIVDLKNTKTEKLRWCRIYWQNFEEPRLIVVYATSMQSNWDRPAEIIYPGRVPA